VRTTKNGPFYCKRRSRESRVHAIGDGDQDHDFGPKAATLRSNAVNRRKRTFRLREVRLLRRSPPDDDRAFILGQIDEPKSSKALLQGLMVARPR
jgi:hypothetical protein